MAKPRPLRAARRRAATIEYAVRDILVVAHEVVEEGRTPLYLNIGDPNQFDFVTPPHIIDAICRAMRDNKTSYAPSEGIPDALAAIRRQAERNGIHAVQDVFIGTGASECIEIALAALVDAGDNVLTPSPGYPLYPAVLGKLGCGQKRYYLNEQNGWQPDLDHIVSQIDERTRAIVLINPNNPTGSICSRDTLEKLLEVAARHRLVVLADEMYDKLVLEGEHISIASVARDVPVLTFNGLSKSYLGPGLRLGWCITSGPEEVVQPFIEASHRFLRARLCANHPTQYAVEPALDGDQSHLDDVRRRLLARRNVTVDRLNAIDGISCVPPKAAFYAFPRLTDITEDDEAFVKALIRETGVVVVHGGGFGQRSGTAHFRVVFLPPEDVLRKAFDKIEAFMGRRR